MLIAVALDRETAGGLVVAIHLLRAEFERQDRPCPAGIDQLAELAARVLNSEQERAGANTDLPTAATPATVEAMPEYLTPAEYAALIGVHVSTVRRWTRSGQLPAERYGRTIRIPNPRRE